MNDLKKGSNSHALQRQRPCNNDIAVKVSCSATTGAFPIHARASIIVVPCDSGSTWMMAHYMYTFKSSFKRTSRGSFPIYARASTVVVSGYPSPARMALPTDTFRTALSKKAWYSYKKVWWLCFILTVSHDGKSSCFCLPSDNLLIRNLCDSQIKFAVKETISWL